MRRLGALNVALREPRRKTGLFGRKSGLFSAAQLAAEEAVLSEKTVAEEAGSGKAAGFVEGIQSAVAVVAELGSFAAAPDQDSLCIEAEFGLHQNQ